MLKRWQELAEPSFSSCLQSIPGVYTRAEILHEVNEDSEDDLVTPHNEFEGERDQRARTFSAPTDLSVCLERLSFSVDKHSPETPVHPQ